MEGGMELQTWPPHHARAADTHAKGSFPSFIPTPVRSGLLTGKAGLL